MACDGFIIRTPDGDEICVPIYVDLDVRWRDPRSDFSVFDDLRIIATINEGITHISDSRIRGRLTEAVQAAARELALPKGVELGDGLFSARKATAA
ncbi:MAG: hypothetical protein JWM75_2579 [Sphingomonas bacterium]|nr:hypothetical protein [Sphingomonas bacterium]